MRDRLAAPEFRELLEVVLLWAQRTAKDLIDYDLGVHDMAEAETYYEPDLLEYFDKRRREYQETYRAEGEARGIAQGLASERRLLRGQAERKFGAGVGEGIAPLLAGIGDAEGMEAVGGWIIDCATGEELLSRFGNEGGNA